MFILSLTLCLRSDKGALEAKVAAKAAKAKEEAENKAALEEFSKTKTTLPAGAAEDKPAVKKAAPKKKKEDPGMALLMEGLGSKPGKGKK
mmetsp:Transcript_2497/g.5447  ORF Transcript_2497/g.5447 Transcript_2497/m.5447 type:complete len:90 (-) Transcript_2497:106-375(-)